MVAAAPALFTLDGSGLGQAGMLNQSGCCNSAANPAARGTLASLYATGEGQTRPRGQTGRVSAYDSVSKYPRPAGPVQVFVGGVAARIEYAGEAPHAVAGLLQVNFRVPATAPIGDAVPVVLMIGGIRSSEQATMAVRPAQQQVLLVEPDAAIRRRLERALKRAGFNVLGDAAANQPVDLVVAAMPSAADMVTSLRQLRQIGRAHV